MHLIQQIFVHAPHSMSTVKTTIKTLVETAHPHEMLVVPFLDVQEGVPCEIGFLFGASQKPRRLIAGCLIVDTLWLHLLRNLWLKLSPGSMKLRCTFFWLRPLLSLFGYFLCVWLRFVVWGLPSLILCSSALSENEWFISDKYKNKVIWNITYCLIGIMTNY